MYLPAEMMEIGEVSVAAKDKASDDGARRKGVRGPDFLLLPIAWLDAAARLSLHVTRALCLCLRPQPQDTCCHAFHPRSCR